MTTPTDPLIGQLIDQRYLIEEVIARGGMAMVYRAADSRLDRDVALKVMHAHLIADEAFVARFRKEAKQAARLSHPHLIAVYDQGRDGDIVYLAMEYLPSITLRDHLHAVGALRPREALDILDPVLDGLSAAHAAGVMHRDVKPENVLLGASGQVKLGDFGLARAVSTSTTTGTLIGTVGYVSPELVTRGASDARSDIYAVGIMFYEMLTGEQPFRDDVPIRVAYRHVHEAVPAPSLLVPGLAPDLDELVVWATDKDPENRPLDAAAMLGELRQVRSQLSDEQLDADPLGAAPIREAGPPPATATQRTRAITGSPTGPAEPAGPLLGIGPAHEDDNTFGADDGTFGPDEAAGDAPPETPTHRAADQGGRPKRRAGQAWLVSLLVVLLLAAGSAGWYFVLGPGSLVSTPGGLVGASQEQAEKVLSTAGLGSKADPVFDGTVPEGHVVSTSPASGKRIAKGGSVTLRVSKGPELFEMPDVTGKSFDEARQQLAAGNFASGERKDEYDDKAPEGEVIGQSVKAGASTPRGTKVDLTVSKGPEPISVPDVTGKSQDDAERILEKAKLKAQVSTAFSDTIAKGTVISQDPEEGATLFRDGAVKLVVSKGPELVEVPSVVGQQEEQAEKALKDAGFEVKVEKILGGYFGTVRSQDPAGGAKAPTGATITITVV